MPSVTRLAEVVLLVGDVEASLRFYRDDLGMTPISPALGGPVFLRVGAAATGVPQQIVLAPRPAAAGERPAMGNVHHVGLEVSLDALATLRQHFEASGREVRTGVHPFLPVEAIYVDDPDGNEVELVAYRG